MYWCVESSNYPREILEHVHQAETIDKKFEKPLRQHLETYRTIVTVCAITVPLYPSDSHLRIGQHLTNTHSEKRAKSFEIRKCEV